MSKSNTQTTIKNISFSLILHFVSIIFTFITRTFFIKNLGLEYLGIYGLFSNILTILSLAELGIGSAMIYSLYQPLKENDNTKIKTLLKFYKKIYTNISLIIIILGIIIMPLLKFIVNLDNDIKFLNLYFMLYVIRLATSIYNTENENLINADQKKYIISIINFFVSLIQLIFQIIILFYIKSFSLFVIVDITCIMIKKIVFQIYVSKKYNTIINCNIKNNINIDKKSIGSNIKAMFIYKLSGVLLDSTDNILISIMLGTVYVGVYSNYSTIVTPILACITMMFTAIIPTLGKYNLESKEKNKLKLFYEINTYTYIIMFILSLILVLIMNDFIMIWIGSKYIISKVTLSIIILNFYIIGISSPIWIFRDSSGVFKKTKYIALLSCILNIILSIILGFKFGINGILISTAIARITTIRWYEPMLLYKENFKSEEYFKYYFLQIIRFLYLVISIVLTSCVIKNYFIVKNITDLVVKCIMCLVSGLILLTPILIYENQKNQINILKRILNKYAFIKYKKKKN